ncbi:MAG TPA: hypothetical protein VJ767_05250 [Nitrososphaeraceae archaeon]|nr:hypothetical protein [Nitrososphaeraceae archaeon]
MKTTTNAEFFLCQANVCSNQVYSPDRRHSPTSKSTEKVITVIERFCRNVPKNQVFTEVPSYKTDF